jgi:hypothetical protein
MLLFTRARGQRRVAIEFNEENAKAHFRLGAALMELVQLDPDLVDKVDKLKKAHKAFVRSHELQPMPATQVLYNVTFCHTCVLITVIISLHDSRTLHTSIVNWHDPA